MKKIAIFLLAIIYSTVLFFLGSQVTYGVDQLYLENFDTYANGTTYGTGTDGGGMKVTDGALKGSSSTGHESNVLPASFTWTGNWEIAYDIKFPVAGSEAYVGIQLVGLTESGNTEFNIQKTSGNSAYAFIKNGSIINVYNNTSGHGLVNGSLTINYQQNYRIRIVKYEKQFEFYIDDVLVIKTAVNANLSAPTSAFLFHYDTTATRTQVELDNLIIKGNVDPINVYWSDDFDTIKPGEMYGFKDPNGPRLYSNTDSAWKEPLIRTFVPNSYVSAEFQIIPKENGQERVGFYMNFNNRIYVDVLGSANETEFYTRISENGTMIAINNNPASGGLVSSIPFTTEPFNLSYTITVSSGEATIDVYFNGLKTIHMTRSVTSANAEVQFRLFTANTNAYIDNLLIADPLYHQNAARYQYTDHTFVEEVWFEDRFEGTANNNVSTSEYDSINSGFKYSAYENTAISGSYNQDNVVTFNGIGKNQYVFVAQVQDQGYYGDGTDHRFGLVFGKTETSQYDLMIQAKTADKSTSIQVIKNNTTVVMDYADSQKGGGFNSNLNVSFGTKMQIALYVQETYITVYINNLKVIQGQLNDLEVGNLGIRSYASKIEFDQLTYGQLPNQFVDGEAVLPAPTLVKLTTLFDDNNQQTTPIYSEASFGHAIEMNPYVPQGYVFTYWIVNGIVQMDLPLNHAFVVTTKLELIAVFRDPAQYVAVFVDSNGAYIAADYLTSGQQAIAPEYETLPDKPKYTPRLIGTWQDQNGSLSLENITENKIYTLQYETSFENHYQINIENGTGDGAYGYNSVVTATATIENFSHWESNGVIVSFDQVYRFTALSDRTVVAVAGSQVEKSLVNIVANLDLRPDKDAFLGQFYLIDGDALIEYGFVIHDDEDVTPTLQTSGVVVVKSGVYHPDTQEFLRSFSTSYVKTIRAYIIVANNGHIKTIYSEQTFVFNELSNSFEVKA